MSIKERPILFSAPMVRALLEGRKSQTRRALKPQPTWHNTDHPTMIGGTAVFGVIADDYPKSDWKCPYGQPGDRLWVKETWQIFRPDSATPILGRMKEHPGGIVCMSYAASEGGRIAEYPHAKRFNGPWRPSIFMTRWASRILLEITEVRVERLQEISEVDAIDEGIISVRNPEWDLKHFKEWKLSFDAAVGQRKKPPLGPTPKQAYRALWKDINGAGSWDANPWVWVIEFKEIEKCRN